MYQGTNDFAKARTSHIHCVFSFLWQTDCEISQHPGPDATRHRGWNCDTVRDEVSKQVLVDWKAHPTPVISKRVQSRPISESSEIACHSLCY